MYICIYVYNTTYTRVYIYIYILHNIIFEPELWHQFTCTHALWGTEVLDRVILDYLVSMAVQTRWSYVHLIRLSQHYIEKAVVGRPTSTYTCTLIPDVLLSVRHRIPISRHLCWNKLSRNCALLGYLLCTNYFQNKTMISCSV